MQLIRMALHNNSAATVIELISEVGDRANAAISKLPESVILPSRVRYAVANPGEVGKIDGNAFGQILSLGENDTLVPADKAPADLLIISHEVSDPSNLESLVSLASQQLAKREATIVVTATNTAAASRLAGRGFQVVSSIDGGKSLALYSHKEVQSESVANGSPKHKVVIIEPSTARSAAQEFSSVLQKSLQHQGYSVFIKSWDDSISAEDVKGKTYISLLELEQPLLDNLSERDFENVRTIVLNCERLLWITSGDNPALGMVDGFARCITSEIAGTKFQILHLSEASRLQHGPSLATRILKSDSVDNEYREVGGILQVARIFKSNKENESLRYHLKDSTRLVTLADQDDALRLTIGKPGLLDTLKLVSDDRMLPPLQDHEVEIQVKATGLK